MNEHNGPQFPRVRHLQGLLPPRISHPQSSSRSCIQIRELLVLTPGVSLGVFSLRERHNATYNEHMPMNERHTAICNQLAHGKLHVNRPPRQGPNAAHPFHLPANLDVGNRHKVGTRTPNPPLTDQHYKDYTTTIGNKWTQLMPSD